MAIIDILTHYDAKKKAAHAAKTVKHGVSTSTVFPSPLPGPLLSAVREPAPPLAAKLARVPRWFLLLWGVAFRV